MANRDVQDGNKIHQLVPLKPKIRPSNSNNVFLTTQIHDRLLIGRFCLRIKLIHLFSIIIKLWFQTSSAECTHNLSTAFRWSTNLGGGGLCGQGQNPSCKLNSTFFLLYPICTDCPLNRLSTEQIDLIEACTCKLHTNVLTTKHRNSDYFADLLLILI